MRCTFLAIAEDVTRDETGTPRGTVNRLDGTPLYSATGSVVLPKCVLWATLRGERDETATVRLDLNATRGATIGVPDTKDPYRILAIRAPEGTSYHDGVVRLSGTDPSDFIFDLHPLHLRGIGQYHFRVMLNDVLARDAAIELKLRA